MGRQSAVRAAAPGAALRRNERVAILASIAAVSGIAWLHLAATMADEHMSMLAVRRWDGAVFARMLAMWVVMMIGMMLPTATPMTLVYAHVANKARSEGTVLPSTGVFAAGYLLAWSAFSIAATVVQWGLDRAALLSPMWGVHGPHGPALGAGLLIAAGVYQLSPWKKRCLHLCRSPALFFAEHWRAGRWAALRLGWSYGLYCLGCCWVLMGLLFVGGVMNLLWAAAIALFVLAEKVIPYGVGAGRVAGVALIALGVLAWARGIN